MTHTLKQTSVFHKFSGLHQLQKNNEKFNQCLNEYRIYKNHQETALAKRHNLIEAIGLETKLASIPLNKAEKILGYSIKQEAKDESIDGFNDASPKTFKALKTANNQIASIEALVAAQYKATEAARLAERGQRVKYHIESFFA